MRPHDHKALVAEFNSAVNAHELDRLNDIVAETFARHSQATPDVSVRSLAEFKSFLIANRATFPDERIILATLVAEDDRVAFWGSYAGTQVGPMGPFPPSGRRMEIDISGMFRIQADQIAELWITWDNVAALVQTGHFPPASSQP